MQLRSNQTIRTIKVQPSVTKAVHTWRRSSRWRLGLNIPRYILREPQLGRVMVLVRRIPGRILIGWSWWMVLIGQSC